jgi:hypothetical protein
LGEADEIRTKGRYPFFRQRTIWEHRLVIQA